MFTCNTRFDSVFTHYVHTADDLIGYEHLVCCWHSAHSRRFIKSLLANVGRLYGSPCIPRMYFLRWTINIPKLLVVFHAAVSLALLSLLLTFPYLLSLPTFPVLNFFFPRYLADSWHAHKSRGTHAHTGWARNEPSPDPPRLTGIIPTGEVSLFGDHTPLVVTWCDCSSPLGPTTCSVASVTASEHIYTFISRVD